ncbi:MAG: Wzz/FepE/Etk N-terminal domain-containing protein [Eubacteriaceae bacterium]|jgi:capsular polysaccharide biosynthesis protein|nr:Wzz/FepE/Etk N-terminal domain-containing protein [Eubacteriaceae bacterium]MDD4507874.1 Wzz/FepE/Etk N-terminal domain-containing protein [Eubacteriaceae bacterium]
MEEISLQEIIDLLRDNIKFIISMTLICVVLVGVFTLFFVDKKYSSSTTLIVGKPEGYSQTSDSSTYSEVMTNQQLVGTYSEIAKSDSVMSKVATNLNLDLTDEQLAGMVDVTTVNDTELIKIQVTDTSANRAAQIANETAKVFMENVAGLMKINNLQIVDVAIADNTPVSPNLKLNLVIAFLVGFVLSVFVIFLKEMLNTTIKSVDELKNIAGDVPIVAVIPHSDSLMDED